VDLINEFMLDNEIDIFCITETFETTARSHSGLGAPTISIVKPDNRDIRGGRRAIGGIAVFQRQPNQPRVNPVHLDTEANYAILNIENVIVAVGYFPPSMNDNIFTDFLDKTRMVAGDKRCIIL